MSEIEINGIKYMQIERETVKRTKLPKNLFPIMLMAELMGGAMYGGASGRKQSMPQVDIVKEFELIQQKKSRLSANQRKWVERQFKNNYIAI